MEQLLNKRLIVLTGKGGIGKSLCSAALGQYAAQRGLRTLLVERSEKDQLAPLFGVSTTNFSETSVAPNLSCINLSASKCLEEYIVKQLGQKKLFEKVFSHNVVRTFFNTIPGLAEVMIMGRIFHSCELYEPRKFDLVIFDAPASGHMLNLMTTPDAIINSGVGGPLVREVTRVKSFLQDPSKASGVLVSVPESLISTESIEFLPRLQAEGPLHFSHIFMNKAVFPLSHSEEDLFEKHKDSHLNHAIQFAKDRHKKASDVQTNFLQSLEQSNTSDMQVVFLPHLGVIQEPLGQDFSQRLFARVETP